MWRSNDVEALGCLSDALRDEDCGVLPLEWALWARLRPARYLRVMDDRRPPLSVRSRRRTRRAGRCSPPHGAVAGAALRVLAEERIFLAEFDCGHIRNIPTFDWAFPARSIFTIFCHRKVAPKVSAGRKSRGTADGLRLKRYADKLAPAFSTAHPPPVLLPDFPQCGVCCALRATMIYCDLNSSLLI